MYDEMTVYQHHIYHPRWVEKIIASAAETSYFQVLLPCVVQQHHFPGCYRLTRCPLKAVIPLHLLWLLLAFECPDCCVLGCPVEPQLGFVHYRPAMPRVLQYACSSPRFACWPAIFICEYFLLQEIFLRMVAPHIISTHPNALDYRISRDYQISIILFPLITLHEVVRVEYSKNYCPATS